MKPLSVLTDDSLRFHVEDALKAVSANPRNPKATQYLIEAHACERELLRRETIRNRRATVRRIPDPMKVPIRHRKYAYRPNWEKQLARDAAYSLAFLKVCKN